MKIYKCDNNQFDLMLEYGHQAEDELVKLLLDGKNLIEVKTDDLAWKFGNLVVEIGRKKYGTVVESGILKTKAHWYFFKLCGKFNGKRIVGVEVEDLKKMVVDNIKIKNYAWGGRDKRNLLVKIPIKQIFNNI